MRDVARSMSIPSTSLPQLAEARPYTLACVVLDAGDTLGKMPGVRRRTRGWLSQETCEAGDQ